MPNDLQASRVKNPDTSSAPPRTSARFGLAGRQDPERNYRAPPDMNPTKGTVLIVGFNSITAEIIRLALHREGFCVQQAGNQDSALESAVQFGPRLVLQNLDLSDGDSWDLVRRFRLLSRGNRLPVLAVADDPSQLQIARNAGVGFTGFLCRPFLPSHLLHTVRFYAKSKAPPTHPSPWWARAGWGRLRKSFCHVRIKRRILSPTSVLHGRILVIEDNPFQRAGLAHSLTELGLEVLTAEHGFEALDGARICPPDAVICDALAPGLDGFELCLVIRQDPRIAPVPVIITSAGRVAEVDTYVARKVGCNALVQRQADSAEVIEALVACLHEGLKRLPLTEAIPIHFASYNQDRFDAE